MGPTVAATTRLRAASAMPDTIVHHCLMSVTVGPIEVGNQRLFVTMLEGLVACRSGTSRRPPVFAPPWSCRCNTSFHIPDCSPGSKTFDFHLLLDPDTSNTQMLLCPTSNFDPRSIRTAWCPTDLSKTLPAGGGGAPEAGADPGVGGRASVQDQRGGGQQGGHHPGV